MEIYIEYALVENFLFDYALLYLAAKAANTQTKPWQICLSAGIGAIFAVIFPLLILPKILAYLLKFAVGFLMCLLLMKKLKTKNERGRYALTVIFFFIFSFGFGGVLLAITRDFIKERVPSAVVVVGFALLVAFSVYLIGKLYQKRAIYAYLYDCEMILQGKIRKTQGFWDSGNLAMKNNLPVCFVSPSLLYDVILEDLIVKGVGQVCDEMQIHTLGGIKRIPLYKGELVVKTKGGRIKKQVYFATSENMLSREYSILLPSSIFEKLELQKDRNEGKCEEKTA